MSWNASGTFVINSTGQPVVNGTVISATVFNAFTADIATGLSNCICKDGQQTIVANIPWNSNKITGLGAPTTTGDALSWGNAITGADGGTWTSSGFSTPGYILTSNLLGLGSYSGSGGLSGNGQAFLTASSSSGLELLGRGSTYDVTLQDYGGNVAVGVYTGTVNAFFGGLLGLGGYSGSGGLSGGQAFIDASSTNGLQLIGKGSTYDSALLASTASVGIGVLTGSQNLQAPGYGAGTATFDGSGNISSVSDPSAKEFVSQFRCGLPEILAIAHNDKFMGLHKWLPGNGMETDGIYASFFAADDFPIPDAVHKRERRKNSFSDRAVIMALVNAVAQLNKKLSEAL